MNNEEAIELSHYPGGQPHKQVMLLWYLFYWLKVELQSIFVRIWILPNWNNWCIFQADKELKRRRTGSLDDDDEDDDEGEDEVDEGVMDEGEGRLGRWFQISNFCGLLWLGQMGSDIYLFS